MNIADVLLSFATPEQIARGYANRRAYAEQMADRIIAEIHRQREIGIGSLRDAIIAAHS